MLAAVSGLAAAPAARSSAMAGRESPPVETTARDGRDPSGSIAQHASVTPNRLESFSFVDARHGFGVVRLVSGREVLVVSSDGGSTWRERSFIAYASGHPHVDFTTLHHGVVQQSGNRLTTDDGGFTWQSERPSRSPWAPVRPDDPIEIDPPVDLRNLDGPAVGDPIAIEVAWVGPKTALVRTSDNSENFDPATHDTVMATTDGGLHWVSHASPCPRFDTAAIAGRDVEHPWVMCSDLVDHDRVSSVFRSADGGSTWQRVGKVAGDLNPARREHALTVVDDRHAYSTTSVFRVTADGGATWRAVKGIPSPLPEDTKLRMRDAHHGWLLVPGIGLWTTRDGKTWSPLGRVKLPKHARSAKAGKRPRQTTTTTADLSVTGYFREVAFLDPHHGFALRYAGNDASPGAPVTVAETTDGGSTWRDRPDVPPVEHVLALGARRALAYARRLYRTTDAGATWSRIDVPGALVRSVAVRGSVGGMIATAPGGDLEIVEISKDGGTRWSPAVTQPSLPRGSHLTAVVAFGRSNVAVAFPTRSGMTIAATDDAGATWRTTPVACRPAAAALLAVGLDNSAWAACRGAPDRNAYSSLDMVRPGRTGSQWEVRANDSVSNGREAKGELGSCPSIGGLVAIDDRHAYALCQYLLGTSDGGTTWGAITGGGGSGLDLGVTALDVLDGGHTWIVDDGVLFVVEGEGSRKLSPP